MAKTVLIIDSPSGLALAYFLSKRGDELTVIDTDDHLNPLNLRACVHMNVVPSRDSVTAGFRRLEQLTNLNILSATKEAPSVLLQSHETRPFIGFGESKSSAVYPVSQYNYSSFHELLTDWPQLMQELRNDLPCKILPFSELNSINTTDNNVTSITINGTQEVTGDNYIFHCDPRLLVKLLPSTELSSRVRARLTRSTIWSRLALQFQHQKLHFDGPQLIFLPASNLEDPPMVGHFEARRLNDGPPLFLSTWETYIEGDDVDDPEQITTLIKSLKRRIRRAFPDFEAQTKESLSLEYLGHGDFAWTNEVNDFTNLFENFVISSPLLSDDMGIAQIISAAEAALQKLEVPRAQAPAGPSILSANPL